MSVYRFFTSVIRLTIGKNFFNSYTSLASPLYFGSSTLATLATLATASTTLMYMNALPEPTLAMPTQLRL